MATIIEHIPTGLRYVLVGAGYAQWATATPSVWLKELKPTREGGAQGMLLVCDAEGVVRYVDPSEARVVSVDGTSPGELLA